MSTPFEDRGRFIADTAAAAPGVVNLFKNRNTTTTDRAAPGDNASADSIIEQLMSQATNPEQYQSLVDSIQKRSAINFAPVTAEQTGSGGYNSTTLQLLQNDAKARAVAESTQAVTTAQRQAAQIAGSLQASKLQANKTQTQIQQAPLHGSTADLLKSLGAAFAFNKLSKTGIDKLLSYSPSSAKASAGNIEGSGSVDTVPYGGFKDPSVIGSSGPTGEFTGSGVSEVGGVSSTGANITSGGLTSEEFGQLLTTSQDSALSNIATIPSVTDHSILGGAATLQGDGTVASAPSASPNTFSPYTPATAAPSEEVPIVRAYTGNSGEGGFGTATSVTAGRSEVLSNESSATAIGGASAGTGEAGGTAAAYGDFGSVGAEGGSAAGASAGAGAGLATAAELALPYYIGGTVATQVGGDFLSQLFGGQGGGIIKDVGDFFGGAGSSFGSFISDI